MIRLFNVYYSTRALVLVVCEAPWWAALFSLPTLTHTVGPNTYIALVYDNGILKIARNRCRLLCCFRTTLICMSLSGYQAAGRFIFVFSLY